MKKAHILIILALFTAGCGKKQNNTPSPPSAAALIFPDNNAACITGTVTSATENQVALSWHASGNTNSYQVDVKNLLTGTATSYNSATPGLTVTLLRNTPYSWDVVSKSSQLATTAKSDTWKFYNSGPGIISHAPFPAQPTAPTFEQIVPSTTGKVSLTWDCSDVDNDISGYDVYFGTTATPALLQSNVTDTHLNSVSITANTAYYWYIVAKDAKGNTSISQTYQFKAN
jgi:hypothetical protein